jgi:hypothetical protein
MQLSHQTRAVGVSKKIFWLELKILPSPPSDGLLNLFWYEKLYSVDPQFVVKSNP